MYSVVCLYGCNMQRFLEKNVSSHRHFLYTARNTQRVRKPSLSSFCPEKSVSPRKQYPPAFISDVKILLLAEKLGKHLKFITFFVYTMDKIPALFQTWSLTHSQNSRRLITFFRSEIINRYTNPAYVSRILCFMMT